MSNFITVQSLGLNVSRQDNMSDTICGYNNKGTVRLNKDYIISIKDITMPVRADVNVKFVTITVDYKTKIVEYVVNIEELQQTEYDIVWKT